MHTKTDRERVHDTVNQLQCIASGFNILDRKLRQILSATKPDEVKFYAGECADLLELLKSYVYTPPKV